MKWLINLLTHIGEFFHSDKAKHAIETAASLVSIALPIVQEINTLAPNKTMDEVLKVYQHYGAPFTATATTGDPNAVGNALLNLATSLLKDELPANKGDVATHILQTAVQLAVTAAKG